jgi:hypothetical protein
MGPSLYRPRVVFPDLESCFPRNKGLRDKSILIYTFLKISGIGGQTAHHWRLDRQPLVVPGRLKIGRQYMAPVFGELQ